MPFTPAGSYRKTRGIIRRDTRANQPAATDVLIGTIYFVTDELVLERSNGTSWERYTNFYDGTDLLISSTMRFRMSGQNRIRFLNSCGRVQLDSTVPSTQAITTATLTAISFDQTLFDTDSISGVGGANPTRVTCKLAGKYLAFGSVRFASNGTGVRMALIRKNGAASSDIATMIGTYAGNDARVAITGPMQLAVNDYLELIVYQDSGGNLNATGTNGQTYLGFFYLGE